MNDLLFLYKLWIVLTAPAVIFYLCDWITDGEPSNPGVLFKELWFLFIPIVSHIMALLAYGITMWIVTIEVMLKFESHE